eukprot:10356848-Lingulodinium_polyedra.AAC.1
MGGAGCQLARDLGIVGKVGRARRAPVSVERAKNAAFRMGRFACLPVPFDAKCHMAASAGVATGMYGAVCGPPPLRELA